MNHELSDPDHAGRSAAGDVIACPRTRRRSRAKLDDPHPARMQDGARLSANRE